MSNFLVGVFPSSFPIITVLRANNDIPFWFWFVLCFSIYLLRIYILPTREITFYWPSVGLLVHYSALRSMLDQQGLFLYYLSAQQGTNICHWYHALKHSLHLPETDDFLRKKKVKS